jgi:hypothetical protein
MRSALRDFWCPVVTETVRIRLIRSKHLTRLGDYFVQCNQADCQYVEANVAPCPLRVEMFADQISAAETSRAARRESY